MAGVEVFLILTMSVLVVETDKPSFQKYQGSLCKGKTAGV
jgi:hypothetical protein